MKLSAYINLLRPKNLVLIVITQGSFYAFVILPAIKGAGLVPQLDILHFTLFIICTLIIAGSGYVVNDVLDYKTDQFNKPDYNYFNEGTNLVNGWTYYYSLISVGFLLSTYLAWHVDDLILIVIYPLSIILLYFYSKVMKSRIFIGNVVVALFCGLVTAILLICEPQLITNYREHSPITQVVDLVIAYSFFGVLVNLLREISKDMEDMEGDSLSKLSTLPIVKGTQYTKKVFQTLLVFLIVILLIWAFLITEGDFRSKTFFCIFIIAPLGILYSRINQASAKSHYSKISGLLKMVMATALVYIILFKSVVLI